MFLALDDLALLWFKLFDNLEYTKLRDFLLQILLLQEFFQ